MTRYFLLVISLTFFTSSGCKPFPKDPQSSLANAKAGILKVGAVESPPWIIYEGNDIKGLEADLIKQFAKSIDTQIEWTQGSEDVLMRLLEANVLHVVIGGVRADTPWKTHVGLSRPYRKQHFIVCRNDGVPMVADLEQQRVGVADDSWLAAPIKQKDGIPSPVADLAHYKGLIAIEEQAAEQYHCGPKSLELASAEYVFAVPKGENALLVALEESLYAAEK